MNGAAIVSAAPNIECGGLQEDVPTPTERSAVESVSEGRGEAVR